MSKVIRDMLSKSGYSSEDIHVSPKGAVRLTDSGLRKVGVTPQEPKFKENSRDRARRLDLGKPHLYWSKTFRAWVPAYVGGCAVSYSSAVKWCNDQDRRWRPV